MMRKGSTAENILRFIGYVRCYPWSSLYLLPGSLEWNQKKVRWLKKEKYLKEYKREKMKSLRLMKRGLGELGMAGQGWDSHGETQRDERQHRIGESVLLFVRAGCNIGINETPQNFQMPLFDMFWGVMEFKTTIDAKKNLSFTGFMGVYYERHSHKRYMVYHTGGHPIQWKNSIEAQARVHLENRYFGRIDGYIIIGENYATGLEILKAPNQKILHAGFADTMHFFPISQASLDNTLKILELKQNPRWRHLPEVLLGTDVAEGSRHIVGDGITKEGHPVLLLFDMNLANMQKIKRSITAGTRERVSVHCLDEQAHMVESYFGGKAEIVSYEITKLEKEVLK